MRCTSPFRAALFASMITTALLSAPPAAPAAFRSAPLAQADVLPDTVRGRLIAGYLKAYNSDSVDVMHEFSDAHRTEAARARRTREEHDAVYRQIRGQLGTLTPTRVVGTAENRIVVLLANDGGELYEFTFQFEGDEEPLIESIAVEGPIAPSAGPIDAEIVEDTIDRTLKILNDAYVFPEVAAEMETSIRTLQAEGRYEDVTSASDMARMLSEDLYAVCHDLHLRIRAGSMNRGPGLTPEQREARRAADRARRHGFEKYEVLDGNIGYIKFNMFHGSDEATESAAEAMEAVLDTDALIFDIRDNGGGSPNMIIFLSSYLFDEPVHLNSFYNRMAEQTSESWTTTEVPGGRKYGDDTPVYVLTSGRTFSAAEEFTYNLRNLERATIVGEQTGGGAHPVRGMKINDHFHMSVPFARAVNPITGTNWEGVGVEPHVRTSRSEALRAARIHALTTLIEQHSAEPQRVEAWQAVLDELTDE